MMMFRKWLAVCAVWSCATAGAALPDPMQARFIQLFVFASTLDLHGRIQTMTETVVRANQTAPAEKRVFAFDPKGRLVRIFSYRRQQYVALTKVRYLGDTQTPEWLTVTDRVNKTTLKYHFSFNADYTQAYQFRVNQQQVTLVKSGVRVISPPMVEISGEQAREPWHKSYRLSAQGDVVQTKPVDLRHVNRSKKSYDAQHNWVTQQWFDAQGARMKTVTRDIIYLSAQGYCEAPTRATQPVTSAERIVDVGEIDAGVYDNTYFQLRVRLSDQYRWLQDQDRYALMLAKEALNIELADNAKQILNTTGLDFITLFHAEDGKASLLAVAEKLTAYPRAVNGFDVLCQLKQSIKADKQALFFLNAPYITQIGGQAFFTNDVWVGNKRQPTAEKKYFVRVMKGYALLFAYTRPLQQQSGLLKLLKAIEFYEDAGVWEKITEKIKRL